MSKMENTFTWGKETKNGQVDLTNYYNKSEVDNKISNLNTKIDTNTREIDSNQSLINTITSDTERLSQDVEKLKVINIPVESLIFRIDSVAANVQSIATNVNANTNELNQVFDDLTNLENTKLSQNNDSPYITGMDNNICNNSTRIVNLGGKYRIMYFQVDVSSYTNGGDMYNILPDEIKKINNIAYIESIEYTPIQSGGKIFTNYVWSFAAQLYNNRLYLAQETNKPNYIRYVRFKIVYSIQ